MSKTASQKLLRDLNQRIGQLENEKSLMAKYMGKLEAENGRLREAILKYLRDSTLAAREELRAAALEGE